MKLIKARHVRDVAEKTLWRAEMLMEQYETAIDDDAYSEDYLEGLHTVACAYYEVYCMLCDLIEGDCYYDAVVHCYECKHYAEETDLVKAMCKRTNSVVKYGRAYCFYGKRKVEEEEE